ncbi:MAG: radical SAM protein [Rhodopirellula sp.]|nr:radical SAM protein [Rhodopirellula sp.]
MSIIDGAYSPLKIFHHGSRIAELRDGRQPAPVHVQLVVSDLCNQDCRFCAYRMSGYTSNELFAGIDPHSGRATRNPRRLIPLEKCLEVLDDCVELGVRAVQITGGGEPTVHPRHDEIFRAVVDRGLELALVTNGMALRPAIDEILLRARWVRVSLDAGNAASYATIRRTSLSAYHRTLANIRRLVERRVEGQESRARKEPTPRLSGSGLSTLDSRLSIGVGFVVTRDNWREVVDAARTVQELGVDSFRISAVFQPEGRRYFDGWHEEARTLCQEAESLATGHFRVFNLFGQRLDDLRQERPDYAFCGYQHFTTYIGADLNVYRCCNTAYSARGRIGSIRDGRFRDLWRSAAKEADFAAFDARDCLRCQFNGKNRMIHYAVDRAPEDVGFV